MHLRMDIENNLWFLFSNLGFVSHEWSLFIMDIVLNKVFVPGETISSFYCSFCYLCNPFKNAHSDPFFENNNTMTRNNEVSG